MDWPSEKLRIAIYSKDSSFVARVREYLMRASAVIAVREFGERGSVLRSLQQGDSNALLVDLFTTDVHGGLELIDTLRSDYRDVPICLLGTREELSSFPGVEPRWQRRFRHYHQLEKDQQDDLLAPRVEEMVFRQSNWIRGRHFIRLAHEPRDPRYRQTAFIMMWMSEDRPELADVHVAIKEVFSEFGIEAIRADEVEHQAQITDVVLDHIRWTDYLIADLTGERQNVYYELGFAHALGREPILFRKKGTKLHFDVSIHNVPEYENTTELRALLRRRLEALLRRTT